MNDLKVLDASQHTLNKPAIILRDLWKGLELAKKYTDWVDTQLEDFTQGVDYIRVHLKVNPTNNLPIQDHAVTLEVAKHIALMSRTEKGREYRQKLIELEATVARPLTATEILIQQAIALDKLTKEQDVIKQTQQTQALQLEDLRKRQEKVELDTMHTMDEYYAVSGYCALIGVPVTQPQAKKYGLECRKASIKYSYDISKVKHPVWGEVNAYHIDILKHVIGE